MTLKLPQALFGRSNATRAAARGGATAAIALFAVLLSSLAYSADYSTPRPLPDYSLRGTTAPVLKEPVYPRWEGFYFGAQGGQTFGSADFNNGTSNTNNMISYILANTELENTVAPLGIVAHKTSSGTQSYGGFMGYNAQWGEVITGVELNYIHLSYRTGGTDSVGPIQVPGATLAGPSTVLYDVTATSNTSIAITDMLTTRFRAGWTYDRLMPYGFVGLAVGRADISRTASVTGTKTTTPPAPAVPIIDALSLPRNPQTEGQNGKIAFGFTAGLGVEVGILPNLFLRAEWEIVQFPNISDIRVMMNSARVGVGLKF